MDAAAYLRSDMTLAPPADEAAIEHALQRLGASVPADYQAFMRQHNRAEGAIGRLFPIEEVGRADQLYPELDQLHGLIVFGTDGGLEAFAFDEQAEVVVVPWIGAREDAIAQGSFSDFARRLASGKLFNRS